MLKQFSVGILGIALVAFFAGLLLIARPVAAQSMEVYVRNLVLQSTSLKESGTVQGAFRLINGQDTPVSGLQYVVVLSEYDENGVPVKALDDKLFGPVTLGPRANQVVTFSYGLPAGVVGDNLGIRVRAISSTGLKMGWADAEFDVAGTPRTMVEATKAVLVVNDKEYSAEEGPTAYPGDTIFYNVSLTNPGSTGVTVIPSLTLFKKELSGEQVKVLPFNEVILNAKGSKELSLALPLDLLPDVYAGKLELLDTDGVRRAPLLSVRYIVGGDIVTLQSIQADKKELTVGETVNVTLAYTGVPADISGDRELPQVGSATLSVTLYNESNAVVATHEETSDWSGSGGEKTLSLIATSDAKTLRAEAKVVKGERVLSSLAQVLSVEEPVTEQKIDKKMLILGGVVLGIIILGLPLILVMRRKRPSPPPIIPIAMVVFLVAAGLFLGLPRTQAQQPRNNWCGAFATNLRNVTSENRSTAFGADYRPTVFVNAPAGELAPGEQFRLEFSAEACGCSNATGKITTTITPEFGSYTQTVRTHNYRVHGNPHNTYSYINNFSFGPDPANNQVKFTAPSPSQTTKYRMKVKVYNDPGIENLTTPQYDPSWGWVEGYVEFTVRGVQTNPTVDLKVNNSDGPITVPYGSNPNLSWAVTNAQSCSASANPANAGWTGSKPAVNTTQAIQNLITATTFSLSCSNQQGNQATDTVVVNVGAPPTSCPNTPEGGYETEAQCETALSKECSLQNGCWKATATPPPPPSPLTVSCRPTVTCPVQGGCGTVPFGGVIDPAPFSAVGQRVTWKSTVDGVASVATALYEWSGSENLNVSGVGQSEAAKIYSTVGSKTVNLEVSKPDGAEGTGVCSTLPNGGNFQVQFNPNWKEV